MGENWNELQDAMPLKVDIKRAARPIRRADDRHAPVSFTRAAVVALVGGAVLGIPVAMVANAARTGSDGKTAAVIYLVVPLITAIATLVWVFPAWLVVSKGYEKQAVAARVFTLLFPLWLASSIPLAAAVGGRIGFDVWKWSGVASAVIWLALLVVAFMLPRKHE